MDFKFETSLDKIGLNILKQLQANARISYSEIGRRVGLSSPAVAERIKRLEDIGIISGYHANVDYTKVGFPILAFVFLTSLSEKYNEVYNFIEQTSEIIECHCISGNESFIIKAYSRSVSQLDQILEKLSEFGETKTTIVLSSPIQKNFIAFNKSFHVPRDLP